VSLDSSGVHHYYDTRRAALESFFFIIDRLSGTIFNAIQEWKKEGRQHHLHDASSVLTKTKYALQIASALEYVHQRRIIYRDLKPQNIGLTFPTTNEEEPTQTIQLFDFGFCRELPPLPRRCTRSHPEEEGGAGCDHHDDDDNVLFRMSRVGSPAYMAPELYLNGGKYNAKADVYSFSLVYYEMLFLKHALGRGSLFHRFKAVAARGVRPDLSEADLPASIKDLLQLTWHQSVPDRINMSEACARLQNVLQELSGEHSTATTASQIPSSETVQTQPSGGSI